MTTVYFVRHGEIENPADVTPFRAKGYPLSKAGVEHVEQVSRLLANKQVATIFSSPILRCRQTAEIIVRQLQNKVSVSVDERLNEVGSPFTEMKEEKFNPTRRSLYEIPEQLAGGESAEAIVARMRAFLDEILGKYAGKTVVAVSHGDPIMLLWCTLLGKDFSTLSDRSPEYIPRGGCYELKFVRKTLVSQRLILL